ncbi:MAG: AAA family ATPase [Sphaerochaetaceae bacterium]
MRVAISGKSGCGNTTVSSLLAKNLNFPLINFTFRALSEEKGIDFWTFCEMAKQDDNIDKELDRRQVEMALGEKDCVLGSRLAIWMLKDADLKVYLIASDEVRAKRVFEREGGNIEDIMKQTSLRDESDSNRYLKIYNIDNSDTNFADLVIDTEIFTPEEIVEKIIERVKKIDSIENK